MTLTTDDVNLIVAALRREPNGLLFREKSQVAVYAVSIIDGTKRHINSHQSRVMNLANVKPLVVPDGYLDAFKTVTS